jgi:alpha-1,2-mannosyltransferase
VQADPRRRITSSLPRGLVETVPALLAALVLLPWIIAGGRAWPWQPAMIDLDVYIAAVNGLRAGGDIYLIRTPGWNLPFIYPPIAALLFVPLALIPLWAAQLLWAVLTVAAQQLILVRAGVRRGLTLGLVNVVLVAAFEPFRTTLGYGQVNTLLMALVVADLLPGAADHRRLLPRGFLLGLAAAIKLTPLAFLVFAALAGRRRTALIGSVSFLVLTAIGVLVLPAESMEFVRKVVAGDLYGDPVYVGNQSINAVFARLLGTDEAVVRAGLAVSALIALAALIAAVRWWRRGQRVLAIGLIGLATCLASPLSWTHHHVWALLVGLTVLVGGLPGVVRGLGLVWTGWVAMCPMLAFLPYAGGNEYAYTLGQSVVANLGPLLGAMLVAALLGLSLGGRAGPISEP